MSEQTAQDDAEIAAAMHEPRTERQAWEEAMIFEGGRAAWRQMLSYLTPFLVAKITAASGPRPRIATFHGAALYDAAVRAGVVGSVRPAHDQSGVTVGFRRAL